MKAPLICCLGLLRQNCGRHMAIVGNTTHTPPVALRNPPGSTIFSSPDKGQCVCVCVRTGKFTSKWPKSTDRAEPNLHRCSNHRQTTFGFQSQNTCCLWQVLTEQGRKPDAVGWMDGDYTLLWWSRLEHILRDLAGCSCQMLQLPWSSLVPSNVVGQSPVRVDEFANVLWPSTFKSVHCFTSVFLSWTEWGRSSHLGNQDNAQCCMSLHHNGNCCWKLRPLGLTSPVIQESCCQCQVSWL